MKINKLLCLGHIFLCFFLNQNIHAKTINEILSPVFLTPSALTIDLNCEVKLTCLKRVEQSKKLLTEIFHSLNRHLYSDADYSAFKHLAPAFKDYIDQNPHNLRKLILGDAEQIISYAIQNISLTRDGKKVRVNVYVVLFLEGVWIFEENEATFIVSTNRKKVLLESYKSPRTQ